MVRWTTGQIGYWLYGPKVRTTGQKDNWVECLLDRKTDHWLKRLPRKAAANSTDNESSLTVLLIYVYTRKSDPFCHDVMKAVVMRAVH